MKSVPSHTQSFEGDFPPSLLCETTVVAYMEFNLPLVLEQWVWVGLNTVIYDFALAAQTGLS